MTDLKVRLVGEAGLLMDSLHKPWTAYNFGGRDNDYNEHEFAEPDLGAKKTIITTVAIIIDKVAVIEKLHNPGSADNARDLFASWLATVVEPVGEYDPTAVS